MSVEEGAAPPAPESSVARGFAVLEVLAQAHEPVRLSSIAARLNMQKSTVHRALTSLVKLGYAEQVPVTACYRPTLRLWELGAGVIAEHPVKRAASGFLQALHRATAETVSLTILSGDDVLYLDKIVSPRPIRFTTRIGSRAPALLTAGGKAMLAHQPGRAAEILKRMRTRKATLTLPPERELLSELQTTRARGYAQSSGQPGVVSIAASVPGRDGAPAAALSVSAPLERMSPKKQQETIEHVLTACAQLAERVGAL